jgi:hypothetical protein
MSPETGQLNNASRSSAVASTWARPSLACHWAAE